MHIIQLVYRVLLSLFLSDWNPVNASDTSSSQRDILSVVIMFMLLQFLTDVIFVSFVYRVRSRTVWTQWLLLHRSFRCRVSGAFSTSVIWQNLNPLLSTVYVSIILVSNIPTLWIHLFFIIVRFHDSEIFILRKRPRVKVLFPLIHAHLDFAFKMSISSAICIEKEPERIWQIQRLRTDDIPTWPMILCDTNTNFYTLIGSFPHGAYLHTWHTTRILAGWLLSSNLIVVTVLDMFF